MTNKVYANRNSAKDFILNAFNELSGEKCEVLCAVAFFTDDKTVLEMVNKGCRVNIVVRLGYPTSPFALKKLLSNDFVKIRYFTDHHFHPKLFIFGQRAALVGSANLTSSALMRNQEVCVVVNGDEDNFPELTKIFYEYWSESKVLNLEILSEYEAVFRQFKSKTEEDFSADLEKNIGSSKMHNVTLSKNKKTEREIFVDDFERNFQDFRVAFNRVEEIYRATGIRMVDESFPLKIEIDSFLSFIWETEARGNWETTNKMFGQEQENFIVERLQKWSKSNAEWLRDYIVPLRYPKLSLLRSGKSIEAASELELFESISVCHALYDHMKRTHGHDLQKMSETFWKSNDPKHVKEVLTYLVHGDETFIKRMYRCIYLEDYKVNHIGRSFIQEVLGWIGKEDIPICNGRTTKVMKFLGFDVQQISDM